MSQRKYLAILSCLVLIGGWALVTLPAAAQQVSVAQLSGQVMDATGSVITDAKVVMTETEKGIMHVTVTNSSGNYIMPGLPSGAYQLEISSLGFKTYVRNDMTLLVNDHLTINATLEVGSTTESVEVKGGAESVQMDTASISSVIESQRITELPLNGRMPTQLVLYAGAAVDAPSGDEKGTKSFFSSQTYSVAGGQHNATNYVLDGSDWNDPIFNVNMPFPIPDALQEFSVETSALPARNGSHPGGAVNAVTKSGTNRIHGTLFDYYRSGNFNASRRVFTTAARQPDSLLRNQYGGTIGGKIIANKLFYFGAYQATRAKSSSTTNGKTATQAMLDGNFTTALSTRCLATAKTLTGFPTNQISPASYDPAAVKLFSSGLVPLSTDPCGAFSYAVSSIDNEDQAVGRIDWARSQKQSLYFRYLLDDYRHPAPFDAQNLAVTGPSTSVGNLERAQGFSLGDVFTVNSALTNAFHFSFARRRNNRAGDPRVPTFKSLGVNMFSPTDHYMALTISNYFVVGCGTCTDARLNANTWQLSDDIDWLVGKHHVAFGGNAMYNQTNTRIGYINQGSASFNNSIGDEMANFLLGRYNVFSQSNPQNVDFRVKTLGLYAQDTYKLSSKATITMGVRWEPTMWPSDSMHRGSQFRMADFLGNTHSTVYPNAPAGTFYFGDTGVPATFTKNHMWNFSPRIGIAWDPKGNGTSSIRAGYGILYDSSMTWMAQRLTSNPPITNQIDLAAGCGTFSNPWLNYSQTTGCGATGANQNPFPVTTVGNPQSFPVGNTLWVSLPQSLRPMYMQQWNLSYEQQFLTDWAFSVAYLGSKTLHIPTTIDLNIPVASTAICAAQPALGSGSNKHPAGVCWADNEQQRRFLQTLYPATDPRGSGKYGAILMADDHQYSNYNAVLGTLRHRFGKGINYHANYTFSKCLSTADFNGDFRSLTFMLQNNPRLDYGACNLDMRHIFNSTLVAASPFQGTGWQRLLLGGWQIAPAVRAYTGLASNVTLADTVINDGTGIARPIRVAGQPLYTKKWISGAACGTVTWCYQYYNPDAFASPNLAVAGYSTSAPYNYTPIQRNMLHLPGVWNVDASLSRAFQVREGKEIAFRFDVFNAFNHYNPSMSGSQALIASVAWSGSTAPATQTTNRNARFGQVTGPNGVGFMPSIYDPRILQFSLKLNY